MDWTIARFPRLENPLRRLAEQHRELEDEPLHLALAFDPGRDPDDVFLFELLGHFGGDEINPERELFEVTFDTSRSLPLESGQKLHLILTHPGEFRFALASHWKSADEIRDAVRRGDFEILFADEVGREALEGLR